MIDFPFWRDRAVMEGYAQYGKVLQREVKEVSMTLGRHGPISRRKLKVLSYRGRTVNQNQI